MRDIRWALHEFVSSGRTPPFFHNDVKVFPVDCKTTHAVARLGHVAHRVVAMAGVMERGRIRYAAKWLCGAESLDVQPISDDQIEGGKCASCEMDRTPAVYRCFNASGDLLYIGSTTHRHGRMRAHSANTEWWGQVADVEYTDYPSLVAARTAEQIAIAAENPRHNKARPSEGRAS